MPYKLGKRAGRGQWPHIGWNMRPGHIRHQVLAAELKDVERKVQQAQRAASIRLSVCVWSKEERGEALERLMTTADDIRAELDALARCSF